jgi:FkbM family methyltransferase
MHGATQNIYCGINDYQDMSFLLHLLRPGELFVDVGANVGAYTVLASAVIGACTLACEPNPGTLDKFRRNIRLNGISELVDERAIAVGAQAKVVRLFTGTEDAMNRVVAEEEATDTIEVPQLPLDALLEGRSPRLLKVDVEGYEPEVLEGASRTLAQSQLLGVILESNPESEPEANPKNARESERQHQRGESDVRADHTPDRRRTPHSMLLDYGFQLCSYEPRTRTLLAVERPGDNGIYVRDLNQAQALLRQAPFFTVFGQQRF